MAQSNNSVAFQLFERTYLHYLLFSNNDLINAALDSVNITDDKERQAYQAQIEQNNRTHVIAAFKQTNNGDPVISQGDFFQFIKLIQIDHQSVLQDYWNESNTTTIIGGKTKKRRKLIGGTVVDKWTMHEIHEFIPNYAYNDESIKQKFKNLMSNFVFDRAIENFNKALKVYNDVTTPNLNARQLENSGVSPSRMPVRNEPAADISVENKISNADKAGAVAAAAHYIQKQNEMLKNAQETMQKNKAIEKIKALPATLTSQILKNIETLEITDYINDTNFCFTLDNNSYMYDETVDPSFINLTNILNNSPAATGVDADDYLSINFNTNNVETSVENVVKFIMEKKIPMGLQTNLEGDDYAVKEVPTISHQVWDDKTKSTIKRTNGEVSLDSEYSFISGKKRYDFSNYKIYEAIGDGNCLIHAFLFLSTTYRKINRKRADQSYILHVLIGIYFREFISKRLTQEIFDDCKIRTDTGSQPEFNSLETYKNYIYGTSNTSPLTESDADIIGKMFNINIDILNGATLDQHSMLVCVGVQNDNLPRIVMINMGGHYNIILKQVVSNYGDIYSPEIELNSMAGGRTRRRRNRHYSNQKRKTYRK